MIKLTIPAIPVAQPRQRQRIVTGKAGQQFASNYTPARHPVNQFKATCRTALAEVYQGPPLDGPVIMVVDFVMPRPKAQLWKTKPMPRLPHDKKPDLDNLCKSLKDALTGLAWRDDSQVWELDARKWIASGEEQPHVQVEIYKRQ